MERIFSRYTWKIYACRLVTLGNVYTFWKRMTSLESRETKRYLEMFYILEFRRLVAQVTWGGQPVCGVHGIVSGVCAGRLFLGRSNPPLSVHDPPAPMQSCCCRTSSASRYPRQAGGRRSVRREPMAALSRSALGACDCGHGRCCCHCQQHLPLQPLDKSSKIRQVRVEGGMQSLFSQPVLHLNCLPRL